MSKTKCPPYTGLRVHEIRRVFELSCGSKKSLDPVEVTSNLQSRCPKVAVQGELSESVKVPNWGWAREKLMTQSRSPERSVTTIEVPSNLIDLDGQEISSATEKEAAYKKKEKL
jgi:hypothetical protein